MVRAQTISSVLSAWLLVLTSSHMRFFIGPEDHTTVAVLADHLDLGNAIDAPAAIDLDGAEVSLNDAHLPPNVSVRTWV